MMNLIFFLKRKKNKLRHENIFFYNTSMGKKYGDGKLHIYKQGASELIDWHVY